MARNPDVAIVGGGVIGLTCAYFLARAGFRVELFDRGDLGKEASWAGAGIIPPGNPERSATPLDRLRAIGAAEFPEFSRALHDLTGIDNGYLRCGGVEFFPRGESAGVLPLWQSEGIEFTPLTRDDFRMLEIAGWAIDEFHGHAFALADCAQVRNPWHIRALIAACEHRGVRLRPNTAVAKWLTEGDRVAGLQLANGDRIVAGRCLLASGAWSDALLQQLGASPGVHPVRGQIVLFHNPQPRPTKILMFGKRYLVPRGDGRVLVGSTEEPEARFNSWPTPSGVGELLAYATRLFPAWAGAEVEKCWAGLRPGTPDGLPFIGPVPGWENIFLATGHFRAGVQLSIGTARAIAELLAGKPACVPLAAFAIDREPRGGGATAFRS
jgi:glycine oxidase